MDQGLGQDFSARDFRTASEGRSAAEHSSRQDTHAGEANAELQLSAMLRAMESGAATHPPLHNAVHGAPDPAFVPAAQGESVEEFSELLMHQDLAVARAYVEAIRARGTPLATVYLHLLAPAARHVGKLWEKDRCDFAAVTICLCRLHQLLRELSPSFQGEADYRTPGLRCLLTPMPGEQHGFGLSLVAEFFRRAGWEIWTESPATADTLVKLVQEAWFAVVGISVGHDLQPKALAEDIRRLRRASRNPDICIMVGGAAFVDHPEFAAEVGADGTAADAQLAALLAHRLLAAMSRQR
jgi:methanogenic corrinoid protein MtbC1